jgi:hypothetical protein
MMATRRALVKALGAAVMLSGSPAGSSAALADLPPRTPLLAARLRALLPTISSACAVGQHCHTLGNERVAVSERLADAVELLRLTDALSDPSLKNAAARINGLMQSDFAAGRTLVIDGWVISETEARLGLAVADVVQS